MANDREQRSAGGVRLAAGGAAGLWRARSPRLRYSLRALLLVVTALALWLGMQGKRARDQRRAVEQVEALGGSIVYSHQYDADGNLIPDATPPGPKWLRDLLGDEWFIRIRTVGLHEKSVTNESLAALMTHPSVFEDVERLRIEFAAADDNGMDFLKGFDKLLDVSLYATPISDQTLKMLSDKRTLRSLNLGLTEVSDAGLTHLEGLVNLQWVILTESRVTDEGVARLRKSLPGTRIHYFEE